MRLKSPKLTDRLRNSVGSEFQTVGPATEKGRRPTVGSGPSGSLLIRCHDFHLDTFIVLVTLFAFVQTYGGQRDGIDRFSPGIQRINVHKASV